MYGVKPRRYIYHQQIFIERYLSGVTEMNVGERPPAPPDHVLQPPAARAFAEYMSEVCEHTDVRHGFPLPLGAFEFEGGVNFSLFSRDATRVRLEFFAGAEDSQPSRVVDLDPTRNRTGDVWHVWVKDIPPGQLYAYRVDGPHRPEAGQLFNFDRLLLDPCATAIKRPLARNATLKCVYTRDVFEWGDDQPPRHPWAQTLIYETHVRGLTAHASSRVHFPGTFRGLTEKIPYLKDLGVTAIELQPVQEFDATVCRARDPRTGRALRNYWGYDPISFFAPNGAYSSAGDSGQQRSEFKEMVRQLHAAGIEVIIDIVLNHTGELDEHGPTLSWRGIDNPIYYSLTKDKRHYLGVAGTGNTINANHPVVRQLIVSALRYWVVEMHVDGFRFDLASILGRDSSGQLLKNAPLLEQIAEDPVLGNTKLIAEAWDAAGAYQVGSFSERRWAEWNGRYRDDVRRFWRGDAGMLGAFASRICGSEDLYVSSGKGPECSINFISCHDGFTLNDLVSYRCKHNLANGESDCDGVEQNYSANYGAEGPSENPEIESVRKRQIKNFLLTLFISRGVPMLLGGDEFRRTQRGNNNAYCQDNDVSWYDWGERSRNADVHDFVKQVIALRRAHPVLSREEFYTPAEVSWLTATLGQPDWNDPDVRTLGCLIRDNAGQDSLYFMFNAEDKPMSFLIPPSPPRCQWQLVVDTASDMPVSGAESRIPTVGSRTLESHSSVVLVAVPSDSRAGKPVSQPCAVKAGGCDPAMDACAKEIGGDDPATAYAAAMLWYQGYPDPPHPVV
jgi:isoamylase